MTPLWPAAALALMVAGILAAQRRPALRALFRWLPVPLWCYALPMLAVTGGLLPAHDPAYGAAANGLLPLALACLLLGADLPAVAASGRAAVSAALIGAAGILLGAPLGVWLLRTHLPAEAWKGAGALAATWTGGTMNLLSMRSVLQIPEGVFAPLIIVDAAVAYGWMALLVAASARQPALDGWLRAAPMPAASGAPASAGSATQRTGLALICLGSAALLALAARLLAPHLPVSSLISSAAGWRVLLVTSGALAASLIPAARRLGAAGATAGYPLLYVVLAATGAQADLRALWAAPAWLLVGLVTVLLHGVLLAAVGRWLRLPAGLLATASQANIGGVVSAPMVGAVYHESLVPVGLLLAMAGNALGTYLGMCSAGLARWLLRP